MKISSPIKSITLHARGVRVVLASGVGITFDVDEPTEEITDEQIIRRAAAAVGATRMGQLGDDPRMADAAKARVRDAE